MANQQIVDYIRTEISKGTSEETILNNLKSVGWSEEIISESINLAHTNIPISKPEPVLMSTPSGSDSINSPYSSILAVLFLVISLLILTNGIFTDIKNATPDENTLLLFEGLFAIPFTLIAFLLHSSFKEDKKRFKILSYPYFIISAWILLRLLWKVGENIWQANNALGVYVVLGMVIVVLTGIIIFVQKYIKK